MLTAQITLDAALRDIDSEQPRYRFQAAANLAPALLEEIGKPGPRWKASKEHAKGSAVVKALLGVLADHEPAPLRGTAAVGLGTLGEPAVLDPTEGWLNTTGDDEEVAYLRESAVLASSYLGRAALDAQVEPAMVQTIRKRIEQALQAPAPDLRYQAATALVELWDADAEPVLVEALRNEPELGVRQGLVDAIAYLDPPGPDACDALEEIIASEDGQESIGFDAAVTLAGARWASARPRLLQSLLVRHQRDRALEALAALGPADPPEIEQVQQMAKGLWLPSTTRVRVAYALCRMAPAGDDNPGQAMLRRLRWHPRPAVREAVRDAVTNLETLADRDPTP